MNIDIKTLKVIHIADLLTSEQYDLLCEASDEDVSRGDAEHTLITKLDFICFMEKAMSMAPSHDRDAITALVMKVSDDVAEDVFFAFPS